MGESVADTGSPLHPQKHSISHTDMTHGILLDYPILVGGDNSSHSVDNEVGCVRGSHTRDHVDSTQSYIQEQRREEGIKTNQVRTQS